MRKNPEEGIISDTTELLIDALPVAVSFAANRVTTNILARIANPLPGPNALKSIGASLVSLAATYVAGKAISKNHLYNVMIGAGVNVAITTVGAIVSPTRGLLGLGEYISMGGYRPSGEYVGGGSNGKSGSVFSVDDGGDDNEDSEDEFEDLADGWSY